MSVNGKRENISADDLLIVGKQMNIKKDKEIIKQVNSVISRWMTYAQQAEIPEKQAISIGSTHCACHLQQ
jgi:serine/threonine-protein kinase HipA